MFLSKVSVKRPYFASMLNIIILIFGLLAFAKIGIDRDPNVDLPFVAVGIHYKGMNPKTAEQLLLNPMEEEFKSLPGLKRFNGTAAQDSAFVFLEFNLDVDMDKATADVRNSLSLIDFPKEAEKPYVEKINENANPFMILNITSNKLTEQELSTYVSKELKPLLQRVEGVGQVSISGTLEREIHINLNSAILNALQLSPTEIKKNIKDQIINIPSGTLRSSEEHFSITTNTIPDNLNTIAKIPIAQKDKPIVRVEDFATIQDTNEEPTNYSEINGKKSVTIQITKQAKGNIVKIASDVRKTIQNINNSSLKDKVVIAITLDQSGYIKNSYDNVVFDIVLGSILAVLVVFIFLHDWRNTLICSIAIPTSLIGTLAVIHYLGFTLNFMTLLALTLSIGILVDDAIVVIENIHRHKMQGKSIYKAAIEGSDEIGLAALAVTLAIVAVFVPVAFMEGIIGRFFYEFGITVASAVLISLFVAFTVVPMLSSKLAATHTNAYDNKNNWADKFDYYFTKFQNSYQKILKKSLKRKKTTLLIGFTVFVLSILLLKFVPAAFQPDYDESETEFTFNLAQGIPLAESIVRGQEIRDHIHSYPGVKDIVMQIGSGRNTSSNIKFTILLVDPKQRKYSTAEFSQRLNSDATKFIRSDKEKIGSVSHHSAVQLELFSIDSPALYQYSKQVLQYISKLPDIGAAVSSVSDEAFEYRVVPDFIKAATLGISPNEIAETLKLLYKGVKVGDYYAEGRYYDIKVLLPFTQEQSLSNLSGVLVSSAKGSPVLLSSIASIERVPIEPVIQHVNGITKVSITADFYGKDLAGTMAAINKYVAQTKPKSIDTSYSGDSEHLNEAAGVIVKALLLATLFIFIVLSAQFENFKAPLAIMFSVPLAFSGAFLALLISGQSLTIFAMIGLILLLGLVTKNAILLIEFAQQKIIEGIDVDQALLEAAIVRLRPIMMTTLTMIAGMLPLVFSTGAGHESNSNLGVTVTGGLISSTILTLVVVPCVYSILVKFKFPKKLPYLRKAKKI